MSYDVFISYSSHDKTVADATCAVLEANKIRCWIAPRDVLPGIEYGEAIVDAIEQCRVLVLIFSAHANQSPHIRREVERAISKGKIVVPLRIEDVVPTGALEYCLGNTHWLNALTPPLEAHIGRLCSALTTLLGDRSPQPPENDNSQSKPDTTHSGRVFAKRFIPPRLALGIAIIVATLVGIAVWRAKPWSTRNQEGGAADSTSSNAQVAAIAQEAQLAEGYANERYQTLASVLHNSQASAAQQIAALRELPDAIAARVPIAVADPAAAGGVRKEWNLPNLIRLRNILKAYMSHDRTQGFGSDGKDDRFFEMLSPLGEASTELFHLLHRLGPVDSGRPEHNLWKWLPDGYQNGIPRATEVDAIPKPRSVLERESEATINLSHMDGADFERLCAPFATYDAPGWRVIFPQRASFKQARFQAANFHTGEMLDADFSEADMRRSCFLLAKLRRGTFFKTNLRAASIQQADLRGARFEFCEASGADFIVADLSGASLNMSGVEGAEFGGAKLDWCRIHVNAPASSWKGVSLIGASLSGEFAGADFSNANFTGTRLEGASFGGKVFFCKLNDVTGPPPASFAWPGLLQPTFEVWDEAREGRSAITFPGAILSQVKGLDTPLEYVRLRGVSRDDCLKQLPSALKADGTDLREKVQDYLVQVRHMSDDEVGKVAWPPKFESLLRTAFGASHVERVTRSISLLRVGVGRAEFNSKHGAAWMDKETLASFTRILADEAKVPTTRDDWVPGKLDEIRKDFGSVEPRGNYFGAWLNDRANWSVWGELEKSQSSQQK